MKKTIVLLILCMLIASVLVGCAVPAGSEAVVKELSRGSISDGVYTSEYADLTFTAPEGWQYATDEEMAELMGVGAETLSEVTGNYPEELLKMQTIYDMMVRDQTTGANVFVGYENLALSIGGTKVNEEEYNNAAQKLLRSSDPNYTFTETKEETIGDQTYNTFVAQQPDFGLIQKYYTRKIDKYMLFVIVSVAGENSIGEIMENFS